MAMKRTAMQGQSENLRETFVNSLFVCLFYFMISIVKTTCSTSRNGSSEVLRLNPQPGLV